MSGPVVVSADGGLLRITLARPDAGNAVTRAMIVALEGAVRVTEYGAIRAVLLDGLGKNFCVGADLHDLQGSGDNLPQMLDTMATDFHAMLLRLSTLPVPVIVAVQGNAVGAGLGLMLAADIVLATRAARFATGYIKLGLSADAGVSYFLTRALGARLARSLLITGRTLDAEEAQRLGLVDNLIEDGALIEEAERVARTLASGPSHAFAAIKHLVGKAAAEGDLGAHLDLERTEIVALAGSKFAKNAISRMLNR